MGGVKIKKLPMFIYTLSDPTTNEIRYVGKTKDMRDRLLRHLSKCYLDKNKNLYKDRWIRKLLNNGLSPRMEILEICDESTVDGLEKYWIAQMRAWGFRLTNISEGGELVGNWKNRKHTEQTKIKLRNANARIIIEYDLQGNKLNRYVGVPHAAKETGLQKTDIYRCCNKKGHHQTKGRTFRYDEDPFDYVPFDMFIQETNVKIKQYDSNGIFLCEYVSVRDAERCTSISRANISKCAKNPFKKNGKSRLIGGYNWRK